MRSRSTLSTPAIRLTDNTIPPCSGVAPPASPVPAPRGVTGIPRTWAHLTIAATSSVERGSTTTSGANLSIARASVS